MWSISIQLETVLNYPGFTIIIIITAVSFLRQYFRVIFSRPVSCEKTRKIILFHHCMSLNAISLFSFVSSPLSFVPSNFQTRPCRQVMDCKSLSVISGVAGNLEYARWDPGLPNEPLQTHICGDTNTFTIDSTNQMPHHCNTAWMVGKYSTKSSALREHSMSTCEHPSESENDKWDTLQTWGLVQTKATALHQVCSLGQRNNH